MVRLAGVDRMRSRTRLDPRRPEQGRGAAVNEAAKDLRLYEDITLPPLCSEAVAEGST
jgi:hypothetical protein